MRDNKALAITSTTRNQGNHASQKILTLITLSAGSRGTLANMLKTLNAKIKVPKMRINLLPLCPVYI